MPDHTDARHEFLSQPLGGTMTDPRAAAVAVPMTDDPTRSRLDGQRTPRIVAGLVQVAELVFPERKRGQMKKKWVIDRLNELIDIPGIPEPVERVMLGALVEAAHWALFQYFPAIGGGDDG